MPYSLPVIVLGIITAVLLGYKIYNDFKNDVDKHK